MIGYDGLYTPSDLRPCIFTTPHDLNNIMILCTSYGVPYAFWRRQKVPRGWHLLNKVCTYGTYGKVGAMLHESPHQWLRSMFYALPRLAPPHEVHLLYTYSIQASLPIPNSDFLLQTCLRQSNTESDRRAAYDKTALSSSQTLSPSTHCASEQKWLSSEVPCLTAPPHFLGFQDPRARV